MRTSSSIIRFLRKASAKTCQSTQIRNSTKTFHEKAENVFSSAGHCQRISGRGRESKVEGRVLDPCSRDFNSAFWVPASAFFLHCLAIPFHNKPIRRGDARERPRSPRSSARANSSNIPALAAPFRRRCSGVKSESPPPRTPPHSLPFPT